jgi:hypothetical protein
MLEENIKKAFLKFAPQLAQEYEDHLRGLFSRMVADLGPTLHGVYSSNRWERTFESSGIRGVMDQKRPEGAPYSADLVYSLNEKRLKEEAEAYGRSTALTWYIKMREKLGKLEDVDVSEPGLGGSLTVTGRHEGHTVSIEQHPILNMSYLGTVFHQFPSHIYVDGKFQSEAQYKKTIQGWGVEAFESPDKKPKRAEIDPNSRPKQFNFAYLADYWDSPGYPGSKGVKFDSSIRGMTEEEAKAKLIKQEVGPYPNKFFSRIHDIECNAIWTWNNQPVWTKSSGEPKHEGGIIKGGRFVFSTSWRIATGSATSAPL